MKKILALRDQVYFMMDSLINHNLSETMSTHGITLTSDQFQIFSDFNKPNRKGEYHYRQTLIKPPRSVL